MGKLTPRSLRLPSRWHFQWRDAVILLLVILICASYSTSIPEFAPKIGSDDLFKTNTAFDHEGGADHGTNLTTVPEGKKNGNTLEALVNAVDVMQVNYFQVWAGLWPTAIDWTSAVVATHIAAVMSTVSSATDFTIQPAYGAPTMISRPKALINRFMSHLMGFYFGQDSLTLRSEAYDDMLWVVLEWLEAIKFVDTHSTQLSYAEGLPSWYGEEWVPGFAHRARIFWDLASGGWDASACGGGMVWSPYLLPYKNAITNQLFITASISMYLNFPGDDNESPFIARESSSGPSRAPVGRKDPKFLDAAIAGYEWLASSNMRNAKGLFIDGFHISHNRHHGHPGERHMQCDIRNEMVYSYNQGVLLSGQLGLWEATGSRGYLEDGHALISSVINATGFNLDSQSVYTEAVSNNSTRPRLGTWHGIGRNGILEEACDAYGTCGQDAQTFKGIFFHHFAQFCQPLPPYVVKPGETVDVATFEKLKEWHVQKCSGYRAWVKRNAEAARETLDESGKAGMWWGAHLAAAWGTTEGAGGEIPEGGVDYRNLGVPRDGVWSYGRQAKEREVYGGKAGAVRGTKGRRSEKDANDRGRGRTVETQAGVVAVLRAAWEIREVES
ncbi:hypothetical protein V495_02882 [Pseudogymnoascus sp. VKM F-4514 (FW-929)]|nr:hypothetical protein V495_02882 [Pseudogymnoascus sp. VKM F-4514 (FW-929)]KFY51510.1 hypothetical protein V497_09072 [Pseudogymnoascus sp. VKM F-4516 (FW-969)]